MKKSFVDIDSIGSTEAIDRSYAPCVTLDDWIFVSAQTGVDAEGELVSASFAPQVRQAYANLEALLEAAGTDPGEIYHLTIWLTDMRRRAACLALLGELLEDTQATVTTTWAGELPEAGASVQLEARAIRGNSSVRKEVIPVDGLPDIGSVAPFYAPCVRVGDLVYLSGQPGVDESYTLGAESFDEQMRQVMRNVQAGLEAGGSGLSNLVTMTTWLTDHRNAGRFQHVRDEFLGTDVATSTRIEANALFDRAAGVEMEAIGVTDGVGKGTVDHPDTLPMLTIERDGETYPRLWNVLKAGEWIFTAGMLGVDADLELVSRAFEPQVRQAYTNLERTLEAAGATFDDIAHTRTYLTDMRYRDEYLALREEILGEARATSTITHTPRLAEKNWLLEFEAIARSAS